MHGKHHNTAPDDSGASEHLRPNPPILKLILRIALSLAIAVALLFFVVRGIKWQDVTLSLKSFDIVLVSLALTSYYLSYLARARRWIILIEKSGQTIPFGLSIAVILSSYAVNCIIPAKAGDIYRCYAVMGKSRGFFRLLGTVVAERVADLLCVLFLFSLGAGLLFIVPHNAESAIPEVGLRLVPSLVVASALTLAVFLFIANIGRIMRFLVPPRYKDQIFEIKESFFAGFKAPGAIVFYTLLVWILELGAFALVIYSGGISLGIGEITFTSSAATLSNAVPFTPGGLGAYELAAREILTALHINPNISVPAILIIRLINYWGLMIVGAVAGLLIHFTHARGQK
ncbi:flippase-like domain-containing protein [bacterium]|nr:flippase-like domain-containing protein [bacterium]